MLVTVPLIQEIPYPEALRKFAHVILGNNHSPLRILTKPDEIATWTEETQSIPRAFILSTPTSPIIVFFHPVERENGSFGVYHQVARSEAYKGKGVVLFPLWTDEEGVQRVVMVKHYRPTLFNLPGQGWELEVPSFGQRQGKSIVDSIEEEVVAEGNLLLLKEPQRLDAKDSPGCPMLPGITSELSEIWLVHVVPNTEEPQEVNEGIQGRVFYTKEEFEDALRKGSVVVDGNIYLTNLFHNFVAAYFATLEGVW